MRTGTALPQRAASHHQKPNLTALVKPIGPNFPLSSEKAMGPHGWMRGSYHFWSLENPIVGPLYRPPWVVGGIHNPIIDPVKHFNTQDRHATCTAFEFAKCFFYNFLPARVFLCLVFAPITMIFMWMILEQRREPMEIYMGREDYWKDFNSYYYGVYFDHHHFSHQLCHRRAHKWGYADQDITLQEDHGHGHH
ncbi:unnamed protein product [Polarella glacialis]|uniref:Uncharacterized protein n=1 Tax=Polarella glacialis TaxID=89957 RepID=A0A813JQI4_POLGL|nr:unnamed protein product [Polarella glacialis]CAE8684013.1 unnamed protein product [Polarella glacialis]